MNKKITNTQRIAKLENEVADHKKVIMRLYGEVQSILKVFTNVNDEEE